MKSSRARLAAQRVRAAISKTEAVDPNSTHSHRCTACAHSSHAHPPCHALRGPPPPNSWAEGRQQPQIMGGMQLQLRRSSAPFRRVVSPQLQLHPPSLDCCLPPVFPPLPITLHLLTYKPVVEIVAGHPPRSCETECLSPAGWPKFSTRTKRC